LHAGEPEKERISDVINERAKAQGSGVVYQAEVAGGRLRPDGIKLEWVISAPRSEKPGDGEGKEDGDILPFFCGDITPRSLRVQTDPPSNTEHPARVQDLAYVKILVSSPAFERKVKQLISVLGHQPISREDSRAIWDLDTSLPSPDLVHRPQLVLEVANESQREELTFLEDVGGESGIYEIAFFVENLEAGYPETARTPYGRIRFVPLQ